MTTYRLLTEKKQEASKQRHLKQFLSTCTCLDPEEGLHMRVCVEHCQNCMGTPKNGNAL